MDQNETIQVALKLVDPEGMLIPVTRQYDRISEMLEIWLRQHGAEKTLEMARNSAKFMKMWWKVL